MPDLTHVYPNPGTYTVVMTVTAPDGSVVDSHQVTVNPVASIATGYDQFVGVEAGTRLQDAVPHEWKDYNRVTANYDDVQAWRWQKAAGAGNLVTANCILDENQVDYFRAVPDGAGDCTYWVSHPIAANFRVSLYAKMSADSSEGGISLLVCGDAGRTQYLEIVAPGSSRIKLLNGADQTELADSGAIVARDRWHLWEAECNGGFLFFYCDNQLLFSRSVLDYPSRYIGIRTNGTNVGIEDFRFEPYTPADRVYLDVSATGSANDGTIENPYTSWAACAAGHHNFADHQSGTRYCFKAGVNFGSKLGLGAVANARYMTYGASANTLEATFAVLETVSWNGPLANGEYWFALPKATLNGIVTASKTIVLMEDGWRMDGIAFSNTRDHPTQWNQAITTFAHRNIVPIAGSLQPGQWAYSVTDERVYMKPSSGTIGDHTYEVSHLLDHVITVTNPQSLWLENLNVYGPGDNKGCIYQENGGDGLVVRRCVGHGGDRGIVFGAEGSNVANLRNLFVDRCESYDVVWKGVSTTGALPWKGLVDPWFVGCYNHDIAPHLSDIADVEGLMTTPGTEGATILMLKGARIGRITESIPAYSEGLGHPVVLSVDGGNDIHANGVRAWDTRTVLRWTATEGATPSDLSAGHITSGYCGNVLAVNCGVPSSIDPNTSRSNALIELQTVQDRNRANYDMAPPPLQMSGVVFEYLTDVGGKYAYKAGEHDAGTFAAVTLNQPDGRDGGALRATIRNYVIASSQAGVIFHYGNESVDGGTYVYPNAGTVVGALVDVHSDNGVIHHVNPSALAVAYRIKCQPCGNQRQSTSLSAIVGRADGVTGHPIAGTVELGVRDANTVVVGTSPVGAGYRPDPGSPAIGRAAGGLAKQDLTWRRRTQNTAGAFEA